MFTGIVEFVGTVKASRPAPGGKCLAVDIGHLTEDASLGDSIAVNGVCLTVTKITQTIAEFDVSSETIARSTLKNLTPGQKVNLERAMPANGRLGGHFVQGHVDGTAQLKKVTNQGEFKLVTFTTETQLIRQMIVKGSVAVDGISLTVAEIKENSFSIAVIPATWENTNLKTKKIGEKMNIETDIITKTIQQQLKTMFGQEKGLTIDKLNQMGF